MKEVKKEMWEKVPKGELNSENISRKSLTYWQDAWRRLKQNKLAMAGLVCVVILVIWGYFGTIFIEFKNKSEYKREYEALMQEGKESEANALYVKQPERKINNGNSNLPSFLKLYQVEGEKYVYMVPYEFKIIVVNDGEIADDPLEPLSVKDDIEIIEENMIKYHKDEYEKIKPIFKMPEIMHQFKFFMIDDNFLYLPYYFWKEKRPDIEKQVKSDNPDETANKINLLIQKELKKVPIFEFYINGEKKDFDKTIHNNKFWFGTDQLGRDIYTRTMYGARISLTVAFVATIVNFIIGVFYGGISGFVGGRTDNILMRIVDVISTIPLLIYVILIQVFFDQTGLFTICLALGIVFWVRMARLVRGQMLSIKEQEYILAAKTIGASTSRLLVRHLIPNAMGPIIVSLAMSIPSAIFTEAFLSFIGIGIAVPIASWGTMAQEATQNLNAYPYQLLFPAIFISVTVLAFNFLGDGLRDALDPRLRK